MIHIKKSPSADSRTATGYVSQAELLRSSKMHIEDVRKGLQFFADKLVEIGKSHDWTKIYYIMEFHNDFSKKLKGDAFKKAHWFHDLHLQERHHLTDRVPDDVNLLDVLERISDICMAGMARSGEIYDDYLDPAILTKAYKNTIELLKSQIVVDPDDEAPEEVQKG